MASRALASSRRYAAICTESSPLLRLSRVGFRARLNAGNVIQPGNVAVLARADDNFADSTVVAAVVR